MFLAKMFAVKNFFSKVKNSFKEKKSIFSLNPSKFFLANNIGKSKKKGISYIS